MRREAEAEEKSMNAPHAVDAHRFDALEDGNEAGHAQKIVRELYQRYEKQLQRYRDYRKLFCFLFFVAWYLATLYLQRDANTSYMVHSTVNDVLTPGATMKHYRSTDEVYAWLKNAITSVWVDPVCGDGVCESPWEFASYSSFGCQADCGKLQNVENLTQVQIDLKWNFGHPLGSVPASNLMQQAYWNLCPYVTPYSPLCYYSTDNSFSQLSGSASFPIPDSPDGLWTLDIKRDIFDKIGGAVRSTQLVYNASYYYKIYIAAASVLAEMDLERSLLSNAMSQGNMSLLQWVNYTLAQNSTNTANNTFVYQQLVNASCACTTVLNSTLSGGVAFGSTAYLAFNQSADPLNPALTFGRNADGSVNTALNPTSYVSSYCPTLAGTGSPILLENVSYNETINNVTNVTSPIIVLLNGVNVSLSSFYGPVPTLPAGVTYRTVSNVTQPSTNMTRTCTTVINSALSWRAQHLRRIQNQTIDWRLGNGQTSGKIAARNKVLSQLQSFVIYNNSEMFTPVFSSPYGTGVTGNAMFVATISALQNYFILGPFYYSNPQPAFQAMTRTTVYNNPNVTLQYIATLAGARSVELSSIEDQTLNNITVTSPDSKRYPDKTLNQIVNQFLMAGATSPLTWATKPASLPDMNSTALGDLRTDYNFVAFEGNSTAYLQCNLQQRGPEYVGTCTNMPVSCILSGTDNPPYNCTDYATGSNFTGLGMGDVSYRRDCEFNCDRFQDCSTLCECWGSCKKNQVCICDACKGLYLDATQDDEFLSIVAASGIAASSVSSMIASVPNVDEKAALGRRSLLQTNTSDLATVLSAISAVQTQQTALQGQTKNLVSIVEQSNALAQARANDQSLINLINQGNAQNQANNDAIMSKLDTIIGLQNQSLAAAQQASAALSTISALGSLQSSAISQLNTAVAQQVTAIKSATFAKIINLTQALMLWKKARRDQALTLKAATLATTTCQNDPVVHNNYTLDNGKDKPEETARERNIGLTNRVVAGMLLHQVRTNDTNCTDSKFNKIQQTCTGPPTLKAYGVDAVFKMSTATTPVTLFNPDFKDSSGAILTNYYNCDALIDSNNNSVATYNISVLNQTVNPYPFCAELFDQNQLPYAFYYKPLKGKPDGFPAFFDINLGQAEAARWVTYLEEGLYIDQHTSSMTAELISYNAPLRTFAYYQMTFDFSLGGSIDLTQRLDTVRVELYNGYNDQIRLFMEIVLNVMVYGMLLYTFYQIVMFQFTKRNFMLYFANGWNIIDFLSNALLAACMVLWWVYVKNYANKFNMDIRYEVYNDLNAQANYLALSPISGMDALWSAYNSMIASVNMLNWYFALNGINILLLIARILRLMDFQPRLGVVTRSLWLAGPDLIHFFIVAAMVFIGYAMMAHLIFGNAIEKFASFGNSVNTCFEMLLGNIDVNNELRALEGLQGVAGALFFWSYELLVFMVLLNFLLAIIVDAFSEVKEKTHETAGVHTELWQLARDKFRSLMGLCSSNYISDYKLGLLLKQWAGADKKKKGDDEKVKLITILNEDLDESDLKTVLLECLKDAPGGAEGEIEEAKAEGDKDKGLVRRVFCLPGGRKIMATPKEIELAAKYIVNRFGVVVDAEEEGEEEEATPPPPAVHDQHQGGFHGMTDDEVAVRSNPMATMGDQDRDQLATALERLADVQRELADGQRNLMVGQKQLADQQTKLIGLMNEEEGPK